MPWRSGRNEQSSGAGHGGRTQATPTSKGSLKPTRLRGLIQEPGMSTNWDTCPAVERDPNKLGGAVIFRGTRIPVATLFENLKQGATVEQFLEWYPGATREQVKVVIDHETRQMQAPVLRKTDGILPTDPTTNRRAPAMLDIPELMRELARERPLFHSEADFQHALAWRIHETISDCGIRLEYKSAASRAIGYRTLHHRGRLIQVSAGTVVAFNTGHALDRTAQSLRRGMLQSHFQTLFRSFPREGCQTNRAAGVAEIKKLQAAPSSLSLAHTAVFSGNANFLHNCPAIQQSRQLSSS